MVGAAALVPSAVATRRQEACLRTRREPSPRSRRPASRFAPASVPAVAIACYGVLGVGFGAINALIFALQADTVEYGEWKSGVRAEGASYAVLSFTRKAGQGIGGAAAAYTIGIGGYVSGAANADRRRRRLDQGRRRNRAGGRRRGGGGRDARVSADREGVSRRCRGAGGAARGRAVPAPAVARA